jgi:hypothetical protein
VSLANAVKFAEEEHPISDEISQKELFRRQLQLPPVFLEEGGFRLRLYILFFCIRIVLLGCLDFILGWRVTFGSDASCIRFVAASTTSIFW